MKNEPRGNYDPRGARFAAALLRFENAARALVGAWHDGVPEDVVAARYPFDELPIDAVCRKIIYFREGVDAALDADAERRNR